MLHSLISLLPSVIGNDGGGHHSRRGGKRHGRRPSQDDLGKWIWTPSSDSVCNSYLYARKTFDLDTKPSTAILKATADSRYKLYVNGQYVGKGPVRSSGGYVYFDTYDVSSLLDKGHNVIAFLVHHFGEDTSISALGRPGLLCKAEIETEAGTQVIATDETWKVHRAADWTGSGARMNGQLGFQEVYDAKERIEGWDQVKLNEKGWDDALVVGTPPAGPWGTLREREIPALAEEKVLPQSAAIYNSPDRATDTPPPMCRT